MNPQSIQSIADVLAVVTIASSLAILFATL